MTLYSKAAGVMTGNAVQDDAMSNLRFNDVRVNQNVTVRFVLE